MSDRRRRSVGGAAYLSGLLSGFSGLRLSGDSPRRHSSGSLGRPHWRSAPALASAARHNVARLPELDYFARKLAPSDDPKWDLPFAKAGQAGSLPTDFASLAAYLDAMQSAAALEFQASIKQAIEQADREERRTGVSGFHPFAPARSGGSSGSGGGSWVYAGLSGAVDFESDSWGRHLVEVQETQSFHVALLAKQDEESGEQVLVVLPTVDREYSTTCHIRSLGYIGPFLMQYDSAQELRYQDRLGAIPKATAALLSAVVRPSSFARRAGGTLLPSAGLQLRSDEVPINSSQRSAVLGLRGGLDIVHGPPGTGKSTTIFHIIDARVLVTCTRNQAVDAVVDKIALLEGGVLVFGNPKRLGEQAAKYTIDNRVESEPAVEVWKESLASLQALARQLEGPLLHLAAASKRSRVAEALAGALAQASSLNLQQADGVTEGVNGDIEGVRDELLQGYASPERALERCISLIATDALPQLRSLLKRRLLEGTRVFVCTIDATARMVAQLQELEVHLSLDTVIVDEAGCVPECAVPLLLRLHPANLALIGDHRQLQSFTALVDPPRNHCRSLMERAVDAGVPAFMLAEQYRMHPSICTAISSTFYGGRLRSAPGLAARRPCSPACRFVRVDGEEEQHRGGGFSNATEAEQAVGEAEAAARTLAAQGIQGRSLFIVTLYNRQRGLILDLLEEGGAGARLERSGWEVAVLSADACQGSEANAVVLSLVRNLAPASTSGAPLSSFFNDRRRINVALSRARHLCVLVGSTTTLRRAAAREPFWRGIQEHYAPDL